jgi:DUF305 family protein family protein
MLRFTPLRIPLGIAVLAAGIIVATTVSAGSNSGAPSLAEYVKAICSAAFRSAPPEEAPFLSENIDAMTRMLVGMQISPSGDSDRDFAAMMMAHHEGAVGMAQAELRYGHNEQLRRLAQEIIVTQQQEIEVMRHQLETPLPTANR